MTEENEVELNTNASPSTPKLERCFMHCTHGFYLEDGTWSDGREVHVKVKTFANAKEAANEIGENLEEAQLSELSFHWMQLANASFATYEEVTSFGLQW